MEPTGVDSRVDIYNLGEAPGEEEDRRGDIFIGRSGQLLRRSHNEIDNRARMRWNNTINCRPPNNRAPTLMEMYCCRRRVAEDIENCKPKIIAGYGAVPLKWLLNRDSILMWRGRYIPVKIGKHICWYFAHVHPAFLLRKGEDSDSLKDIDRTYMHMFRLDLKKMYELLRSGKKPTYIETSEADSNIELITSFEEDKVDYILKRVTNIIRTHDRVTVDFETIGEPNGLSPYNLNAKIITAAIGVYDDTIAFPVEHPYGWPNNRCVRRLVRGLTNILSNTRIKKIALQSKFEMHWSLKYFGIDALDNWHDVLAQAISIDERPGGKKAGVLNLGTQTLIHFGFNVKELSNIDVRKPLEYPIKDLLRYNGMDTKWEDKLYTKYLEELTFSDKKAVAHRDRLAKALVLTENKGLLVCRETAKRFTRRYERTMDDLYDKIMNLSYVKKFQKLKGIVYKPTSNDHIAYLLSDILHLPPVKLTNAGKGINGKGTYSTDKDVMAEYAKQGVEIANLTISYREAQKQKSTYVDAIVALISPDGILHPEFNHLFVTTGRLSASKPNMQNFPRRQNLQARNIIIAPKGHKIVAIDEAQIEARVIAVVSRDTFFCNAIRDNYDIHMDWAIRVCNKKGIPEKQRTVKYMKDLRSAIKNMLVFPWFYGAQVSSVSTAIDLSYRLTEELFEDFWGMFAGVKRWQTEIVKFYLQNGYVETVFGRKRHAPLSLNECLNTPIQSIASDIVTSSMIELSQLARKLNRPQLQPVMNIHDDLTFYLPEDTMNDDIQIISKSMCYTPSWFDNVPLGVEVKIGDKWGEMEEVAKFTTRDFDYKHRG